MLFVIDNLRLQKFIKLTRNDRKPFKRPGKNAPFFRIEASGESLKISSINVESELPATVYEPGVLFLRIDLVARLLQTMREEPILTIQANKEGLHLANVRISLEFGDMLLYVDPARAPRRHPDELLPPLPKFNGSNGPTSWGPLFEANGLKPGIAKRR